ncbi:hypothetical protein REPUB_Repub11eG0141400 [Reevesia pubescens]
MEGEPATLSYDFVVNKGKEPLVNNGNMSPGPESQEVLAGDDTGVLGSGEGSGSGGATCNEIVNEKKRGRGRPRKYQNGVPIINPSISMEAFPISVASSSTKRARGRPRGTGKFQTLASVGGYVDTAGGSFTPHVILVQPGQDLVNKIESFSIRGSRSVCILTASGAVSSVTLCKPCSYETLKYEGRFEILNLTGSSVVSAQVGTRRKRSLLSVSLAHSDGRVFGGSVVGPLIAAAPGPVQLIIASFKQNIGHEIRRKYSAGSSTSANVFASSEMVNIPIQMADNVDNCTSVPAPVAVRADPVKADSVKSDNVVAENHNFNSVSLETVGPNNLQKADSLKEVNLIGENHDFSISPQSVDPNNLQTSPVSHSISDEMITPDNNASIPEMHVKD